MEKKFKRTTVTSALPYANGPVHIGHLAGVYVPADIYVRYLRLKKEDVLFIGGSDEHGVPITIRAKKEGITPQDVVDRYHSLIKKSFEEFGISFDVYSRTTSPTHHQLASDFFKTLYNKGEFIEKTSEQYYDEEAKTFLADRYIVGTCPKCGNDRAYGDQCEKCGSTLSPDELIDPQLPAHSGRPLGLPYYTFRRISHVGAFLARMRVQHPEQAPIHRMVDDWAKSSAGHTSDFCNHWVLAMSEHQDRYLQSVFRAKPIATLEGIPPVFKGEPGQTNATLRTALSAYDRACGYPMAWYFHMLVTHAVPHWVAQTVVEDAQAGFEYLPERDLAVVRHWLHQPYAL